MSIDVTKALEELEADRHDSKPITKNEGIKAKNSQNTKEYVPLETRIAILEARIAMLEHDITVLMSMQTWDVDAIGKEIPYDAQAARQTEANE